MAAARPDAGLRRVLALVLSGQQQLHRDPQQQHGRPRASGRAACSSSTATMVRMIRITTAAPLPQRIACFCCCGGSERAASAITTALSPDSTMLMRMICISPVQNACEASSSSTAAIVHLPNDRTTHRSARLDRILHLDGARARARHRQHHLHLDYVDRLHPPSNAMLRARVRATSWRWLMHIALLLTLAWLVDSPCRCSPCCAKKYPAAIWYSSPTASS